MLKSLYSGVSGLKAHQVKMDVIGNNIANANTTAFKASRVTFQDIYYQTLSGAAGASEIKGGTNAQQIGYGSSVATVDVLNTRGGWQSTERTLDLYIQGDGYFVVKDNIGNINYTRVGNFKFDGNGSLVDSNGNFVTGWMPQYDPATPTDPVEIQLPDIAKYTNITINDEGKISGIYAGEATVDHIPGTIEVLGQIALANFPNPDGLSQSSGVYFQKTHNSGDAINTCPGADGAGTIISGGLEMSNVDLAKEFTDMITAQRGFQANSRIITVSDSMLEELVNLKR